MFTHTDDIDELLADLPPLLTMGEVLAVLRITHQCLHEWMDAGVFPQPIRPSQRIYRWPKPTIKRWMLSYGKAKAKAKVTA